MKFPKCGVARLCLSIAFYGALSCSAVAATPITGSLYFACETSLDNPDFRLATTIDFNNVFTVGGSGDFASVPSRTTVAMNSLPFAPLSSPWSLWSVDTGDNSYSFDLTSISTVNRSASALSLSGTGVLRWSGEDTIANWTLSLNGAGDGVAVSFARPQVFAVPEPAMGWLCGLALVGATPLFLRRRKLTPCRSSQ